MEYLYAPWRGTYLSSDNPIRKPSTKKNSCVFCLTGNSEQDPNYLLKKYDFCYAILNAYPYNPGHILVLPYQHSANIADLSTESRHELMDVIAKSASILEITLKAEGINIGFNIGGKAAGGTIPEHLHGHVLPRWQGDTNFLPTLAQTKQLSSDLNEIYQILLPAFENSML